MMDRLLLSGALFMFGFSTSMMVHFLFENSAFWSIAWLALSIWNCRHIVWLIDRVWEHPTSASDGDA